MPQVHLQLPISGLDCRKRAIWEEKATDGAAAANSSQLSHPTGSLSSGQKKLLNFLVT